MRLPDRGLWTTGGLRKASGIAVFRASESPSSTDRLYSKSVGVYEQKHGEFSTLEMSREINMAISGVSAI
jgi:hypothetical protein